MSCLTLTGGILLLRMALWIYFKLSNNGINTKETFHGMSCRKFLHKHLNLRYSFGIILLLKYLVLYRLSPDEHCTENVQVFHEKRNYRLGHTQYHHSLIDVLYGTTKLIFRWLQLDSNPEPLSSFRVWIHSEMRTWHDKNIQSV